MLLDSYQNHPEAKSLGPDGKPCSSETRGLLQRAHVIANSPLMFIGKESDKHWEEGEDLSLLEFQTIQYRRTGTAAANEEQLARIAKVPKREFMRRGVNQHTLEKICAGEPVRAIKLAKCLRLLGEYEFAPSQCRNDSRNVHENASSTSGPVRRNRWRCVVGMTLQNPQQIIYNSGTIDISTREVDPLSRAAPSRRQGSRAPLKDHNRLG